MTKEKLKKEAEEWLNKWELCNKCENKVDCISNFSYCKKVVLQSYLASAEPREKRIAHLEKSLIDVSEKSVKRIKELESKIEEMKHDVNEYFGYEYNFLVAKLFNKWEKAEK